MYGPVQSIAVTLTLYFRASYDAQELAEVSPFLVVGAIAKPGVDKAGVLDLFAKVRC